MEPLEITAIILVALIAGVIVTAAIIMFTKKAPEERYGIINQILYALAVEAERLYGSKTGQIKKKQVIAWFYERYKWLSFFVTETDLNDWIDSVVDNMNEWLQSNPTGAKNIIGDKAE